MSRTRVAARIVSRAASGVSVLARTGASRLTVDDLTRLIDCDDEVRKLHDRFFKL